MRKTAEQRLLNLLREVDGPLETKCWMFIGNWWSGYGRFHYNGKDHKAHRVAFELWAEPIPEGMDVLHHCDATWCCNPEHLFLGNDQDNSDDKYTKGRAVHLCGSANGKSSITEDQAREAKRLLEEGHNAYEIAGWLQTTHDVIYGIKYGKTWRHI